MEKCKLIKFYKIQCVDDGVCGDVYKQEGIKYYSLICCLESVEGSYSKYDNVRLLLLEEELNKLINEQFYYDKDNHKVYFEKKVDETDA